jgi:hypothetical protein
MLVFSFLVLVMFLVQVAAVPPVQVVASVRGKKFDIEAETVEEFTSKVEEAAGLEPGQQSVLFRGKVLSADDDLSNIGVGEGDVLNVVKGRKQRSVLTPDEVDESLMGTGSMATDPAPSSGGGGGMMGMGGMGGMPSEADLKKLAENPEQMKEAMAAMDQLLDNDYFDEYFADEDKLENARQQMLGNLDQ